MIGIKVKKKLPAKENQIQNKEATIVRTERSTEIF